MGTNKKEVKKDIVVGKEVKKKAKRKTNKKTPLTREEQLYQVKLMNEARINSGRLGGPPIKYRPEFAEALICFMERTSHEIYVDKTYYKGGDDGSTGSIKSESNKLIANTFPTIQRFCHIINIHQDTLVGRTKEIDSNGNPVYPELICAYNKAKQIQESILLENALNGTYNPAFSMFLAKNCFGYVDKSEVDNKLTIGVSQKEKDKIENLIRLNNTNQ
ncbi:MAG: hypothetical protein PHN31_01795 [Candidatus Gracilibacteria bacterium]|nr:hypothetical protein [Candidatus Gracilibacteria bacterium]